MRPETIQEVRQSWSQVLPIAPQAAAMFYERLFALDPSLQELFNGNMTTQGERLMQMIDVAISKLDEPDVLMPALQGLGARHTNYGVRPEHYGTVGTALLQTLEQGLGPAFTPAVREAWVEVYSVMAKVMIEAANAPRP